MLLGGGTKRLPHVHHRQTDALAFLVSQPGEELAHAGLGAVLAAEPDGTASDQIADHDTVGVALAHRDLVDADHLGGGYPRAGELRAHVLLVQLLDTVPVQVQLVGHLLDGAVATAPTHLVGKALGVQRCVGQKPQPFALHACAASAPNAAYLQFQVDAPGPARQIAHPPQPAVVPARLHATTRPADCFFERRTSRTTRACESPNTPRSVATGRKPGNRYASSRRLDFFGVDMDKSCQISSPVQTHETQSWRGFQPDQP